MPRLERDGRYWTIRMTPCGFELRFGEVDGTSNCRTREFESPRRASVQYARAIEMMVNQGYERVLLEPAPDPELPEDDLGGLQVLGDTLQSRGDPRGELLALQVALTRAPKRMQDELRDRVGTLLRAQRPHLLGELAHLPGLTVVWHCGFVRYAIVSPGENHDARDVLPAFFALDASRRLARLVVHRVGGGEHAVPLLVRSGPLRELHTLELRLPVLGRIAPLARAAPGLKDLHVDGEADCGGLSLPKLRRLTLGPEVTRRPENLAVIARSSWPELRSLRLSVKDVADQRLYPLIGVELPRLELLAIDGLDDTGRLLRELLKTDVFPRLKALDLGHSRLPESAAQFLLDRADEFAHLDRLALPLRGIPVRLRHPLSQLPPVKLATKHPPR